MFRNRFVRVVGMLALGAVAAAVAGAVLMMLWNWLMPAVFGLPAISLAQALGLFVLSRLLLGGLGGGSARRRHWRHRMQERWARMSPEERQRFVHGMERRCGRFNEEAAGSRS